MHNVENIETIERILKLLQIEYKTSITDNDHTILSIIHNGEWFEFDEDGILIY